VHSQTLSRSYPSTFASVSHARHAVIEFAQQCRLAPADIADLALAAGEAFNNAVEHGHVEGGTFHLRCDCDEQGVHVRVWDKGKGFSYSGQLQVVDPQHRGVRGLGIFLMRSLMDDVEYDVSSKGTHVSLTKRWREDQCMCEPDESLSAR